MRLPKPVYEIYPALYIVGGIAAMYAVDTMVPFVCGMLLGLGGVVILFMRRNYRAMKDELIHIN